MSGTVGKAWAESSKEMDVGDLPPYSAVEGTPASVMYGALASGAEPLVNATYEHAWQRDQALITLIDETLLAAAAGTVRGATGNRPRWLDGLVARELRSASRSSWSREEFLRVRLLERLGLVDLAPDDTYVLAMVSGLGTDKADTLRADPELVDRAVWRLFEVEGGGEVSLTNVDRFGGGEWRKTFLELTADGTLDRTRVLNACLHALGRDFAAYRANWYSATYRALEPTVEEAAASQAELRRLLGAAVPATVALPSRGWSRSTGRGSSTSRRLSGHCRRRLWSRARGPPLLPSRWLALATSSFRVPSRPWPGQRSATRMPTCSRRPLGSSPISVNRTPYAPPQMTSRRASVRSSG